MASFVQLLPIGMSTTSNPPSRDKRTLSLPYENVPSAGYAPTIAVCKTAVILFHQPGEDAAGLVTGCTSLIVAHR